MDITYPSRSVPLSPFFFFEFIELELDLCGAGFFLCNASVPFSHRET